MFKSKFSFLLSLAAIACLGSTALPVRSQGTEGAGTTAPPTTTTTETTTKTTTATNPASCKNSTKGGGERTARVVPLHYFRQATQVATILNCLAAEDNNWDLTASVVAGVENSITLYGNSEGRRKARQIIAAMDLPRPGVEMQMWGIQISSANREALARVMPQVRDEIESSRRSLRRTTSWLQHSVAEIPITPINSERNGLVQPCSRVGTFGSILTEPKNEDSCGLGYETALSVTQRPLSITDMSLRLLALDEDRIYEVNRNLANDLTRYLMEKESQQWEKYWKAIIAASPKDIRKAIERGDIGPWKEHWEKTGKDNLVPFSRFFQNRGGLTANCNSWHEKGEKIGVPTNCNWVGNPDLLIKHAKISRNLVLEFALQYRDFVQRSSEFSPYYLQQSADILNSRLQRSFQEFNRDIDDFFTRPTLNAIQGITAEEKKVQYAQVGRTTVASISGQKTVVSSNSTNTFNVTPPLSLEGLLGDLDVSDFLTPDLGGARVLDLLTAYTSQEQVWRPLETGVSFTITPNILRNMRSAELEIKLTIADPAASNTQGNNTGESSGGRPILAYIGKQEVETTVYTDAFDLFALSTFSNQSTLNGGRFDIPIIGTVWRGVFGSIPVFGELFSFPRDPQNRLNESIILTQSSVVPTTLGLALLYPIVDPSEEAEKDYCDLADRIEGFTGNPISSADCPDK